MEIPIISEIFVVISNSITNLYNKKIMPITPEEKKRLLRRATAAEIVEAQRVRGQLTKDVPSHYSELIFGELTKKGMKGVFKRQHLYNWYSWDETTLIGKNNNIHITRAVEEVAKQHQVEDIKHHKLPLS